MVLDLGITCYWSTARREDYLTTKLGPRIKSHIIQEHENKIKPHLMLPSLNHVQKILSGSENCQRIYHSQALRIISLWTKVADPSAFTFQHMQDYERVILKLASIKSKDE